MDDGFDIEPPHPLTAIERAQAIGTILKDAARRARLSKRHRGHLPTNYLGTQRRRSFARFAKLTSFVLLVAVPSLLVIVYYAFVASDQFTAETRFTVRGGLPPKLDTIGAITGLPSVLVMQDTQVILNFILSRDMVEQLDRAIGLRKIYGAAQIDPVSRLSHDATIEKLVRYWHSMVDFSLRMPAGIVALEVRAFKPADSQRIAEAALAACETLINSMNDQMIRDTLAGSEMERQRAEAHLAEARANLERARNAEGLLSGDKAAEALNGLVAKARAELSDMEQQYEAQRAYVNDDAPQIRVLKAKIDAANEAIRQLRGHLTQTDADDGVRPLTGSISRLNYLTLENTVAERLYASALALREHAQLAAEAKLLYLNVSVAPARAEAARYPRRVLNSIIFAGLDLCGWFALIQLAGLLRRRLEPYFGVQMRVKAL